MENRPCGKRQQGLLFGEEAGADGAGPGLRETRGRPRSLTLGFLSHWPLSWELLHAGVQRT